MKKIAIFCGGPSSEHEVSLSSAKAILKNIDKKKYEPYIFYIRRDKKSAFYKPDQTIKPSTKTVFKDFTETLKKSRDNFDIALLAALHGEFGEDGTIQFMLEKLGIKYTGSDSESSKLCMDKAETIKRVEEINDIFIPKTIYLNYKEIKKSPLLDFPFIIKPNSLGSSVLVFRISNKKDFDEAISEIEKSKVDKFLIQELIEGIELSSGCLQKSTGEFIELPPIEIRPKGKFFDYKSKYELGEAEEITPPASISKGESERIARLSIDIHSILKCSTYSRSDFIYKNGKAYFLECNTLPGFTATSLLPQEANEKGISFTKLIDFIIQQSI